MKKIVMSLLFISSLLTTLSCDNNFGEINTDPNKAAKVPAHLLLGNMIRVNQNTIYGMQQGGDMGMCWAQHISKVVYNDEERYIPRRGAIDGVWDNLYITVIGNAKSMYKFAGEENNPNLQGIALVMQANAFQILTDLYGPVPFSEVGIVGNLTPKYESQEDVYTGINDLLIEADALFEEDKGEIPATSDLLYAGNAGKWRKLANSLRLKALMRISKKKNVAAEIASIVSAGNLMTSNADSAQLIYKNAQPDANPIYETIVFSTRTEYKMSTILIDKLVALTDTRLDVFAAKNNANAYVGNVPGVENQAAINAISSPGSFYLSPTLPGVILSYSQVEFLLAEAANEGYISGGQATALTHYNNGITANFTFNGITVPSTYLSQGNVAFSTQVDGRKKIAEQNWIALYGQGFEAWTEWRRTKFPVLAPVLNAAETSIPSRLYYNTLEVSLNGANYSSAAATLTGGDKLTSPIWWMN